MMTPYDWQEAIAHRAQYIEARLVHGTPVLAVSMEPGILFYTRRRQSRKLFEIYDQLALAAIGQQSDVEAMRMAAVDFAHQEGFSRSEQDVTIQRVVNAISSPMKRAFADFASAPVVARGVFGEVGATPGQDRFIMVNYDGDYHARTNYAFVAPTNDMANALDERMAKAFLQTASLETAIEELSAIWSEAIDKDQKATANPFSDEYSKEIAILERNTKHNARFRYLTEVER